MAINNIDKPMEPTDLTQAMGEPDIEIEIEDPEKITVGIGGMEIEIDPDAESDDDFNANLAEYVEDKELSFISSELFANYAEVGITFYFGTMQLLCIEFSA